MLYLRGDQNADLSHNDGKRTGTYQSVLSILDRLSAGRRPPSGTRPFGDWLGSGGGSNNMQRTPFFRGVKYVQVKVE